MEWNRPICGESQWFQGDICLCDAWTIHCNCGKSVSHKDVAELRTLVAQLREANERLGLALLDALPWIGRSAEGPPWAAVETRGAYRRRCADALHAALDALDSDPG